MIAGSVREAMPIDWEAEASRAAPPAFAYHSLADLFPETPGLAGEFNRNADFRSSLRAAARDDLSKAHEQAAGGAADSSLQAFVGRFVEKDRLSLHPMPRLTGVLQEHGLDLSGHAFIARLLELCNGICCGSWADIVGPPRSHRWHQDEGRNTYTVMLGFPASGSFVGEDVFSHVARISHRLSPPGFGIPLEVDYAVPEECVFRPVYAPGQEVVVYNDSTLLHRAPEAPNRQALWRLM